MTESNPYPSPSPQNGRRWLTMAVCIWTVLLLGLATFSYCYPWSHTVYDIYARACHHWWSGEDMYRTVGTDYYRYSPLCAVGLTPFGLLPERWGGALWRIVSGLLYAVGLRAWARQTFPEGGSPGFLAALLLLVLPLSLHSMHNGQANVIMLAALLLGLTAAAREHWNRAAVWLALATLIKGYPIALALLLAGLYPRRFLGRYLLALAGGLLLPFATQRTELVLAQYQSWLAHLQESTVLMRERLRTVEHLAALYGQPIAPHLFQLVQLLAGAAALALCLLHARRTPERSSQVHAAFVLFACWAMLFGPATEACTYILIAPVSAAALIEAFRRPHSWVLRLVLIASLLLMGPLVTDLAPPAIRNYANEHGSQPLGALLFLGCALITLRKGRRVCYATKTESTSCARPVSHAEACV